MSLEGDGGGEGEEGGGGGGREERDDCYTYSNGTTIFKYNHVTYYVIT